MCWNHSAGRFATILIVCGGLNAKEVICEVTAYTPWDANCSGITSCGRDSRAHPHGGCAVDPRIFSYGTRFYIEGYGVCKADDTGAAMRQRTNKRNNLPPLIDIRVYDKAKAFRWGRKTMKVWIYE